MTKNIYRFYNCDQQKIRIMIQWLMEHEVPFTFEDWEADPITFDRNITAIEFDAVNDYNWFVLRWSNGISN